MGTRNGLRVALVAGLMGVTSVQASAPNTMVGIKSPLDGGNWDRFAIAGPSYHHAPWGGDWAVDVYGAPGDLVYFGVRERWQGTTAGNAYGIVTANYDTCAWPNSAGVAYRISVYDGAGAYVGWVLIGHVDTSAYGTLPIGSLVANGQVLGKLSQFVYSSCYQVTTSSGVHTHLELYNASDYSCYIPRPANGYVTRDRFVAVLGSNNNGVGQSCW